MSDYLLLFRGGDMTQFTPEERQEHMQKWGGWMVSLQEKGKMKGGEPLATGGKVLHGTQKIITDGPYAESKEIVGGYLLISAESEDEAVEISKQCPIFESNGIVELRKIAPFTM